MNIDLMAPVGSYEALAAAIQAGANSVYFGIEHLNMRALATKSFTIKDLKKIADICKKNKVKSYLTLNTIMYDQDLKLMKKICDEAKKAKITAIIASDISTLEYAKKIKLETHISTQANISNIEAVKFYSKYADVVVLARELNLNQIKNIIKEIKKQKIKGPSGNLVKVELFIHGALCVSVSGKCYMSLAQYNKSANRGMCLQACRRSYKVIDEETGDELRVENKYIMSPKDLCTIGFLDKIIQAGVSVLKIEGRGRHPEYVYTTVKVYREALDAIENKTYTKNKVKEWTKQLESVFNRGFWQGGYYLGKKLGEWSGAYGSKATKEKVHIGYVENYFPKPNVAQIIIESCKIKENDEILIIGPTTGVLQFKLQSLFVNEKPAKEAKKGDDLTIKVPDKVRKNDKVYVFSKKEKLQ
ncbi:U32 family peptidase [Candidatus Woesearchaeota archaeon]|nr:U32 family peptidase [Candidatus Woesearchaeota archaeon]